MTISAPFTPQSVPVWKINYMETVHRGDRFGVERVKEGVTPERERSIYGITARRGLWYSNAIAVSVISV